MSEPEHTLLFLVPLHQAAVKETLARVIGIEQIGKSSASEAVSRVYEAMGDDERILMCHEEPFDAACDIARIPCEQRSSLLATEFEKYSEMMRRFDNQADEIASHGISCAMHPPRLILL